MRGNSLAGAGVDLTPLSFNSLNGWAETDLGGFWTVFHRSACEVLKAAPSLRPAQAANPDVRAFLGAAADLPGLSSRDARLFLEDRCIPCSIGAPGFVTGYYEPVVDASWTRSAAFTAPILPRPDDLVTFAPGETVPGLPSGFAAARRRADGTLEPYPDRKSLEAWAVGATARPIVWVRDWTEVFLIQVQGSARVRLPDGERRLVYAGRNGHPYTSIGRLLVDAGQISMADMSLERLKGWVRAHGQEVGEQGRDLMQRNASYIFFALAAADPTQGPIGGAGLPLTPSVSIAIDRTIWPYGLPFWITADGSIPGFGPDPLASLFVAEDTGSAILGPARADLFTGSGDPAGHAAGLIRHTARFVVLLPRPQ